MNEIKPAIRKIQEDVGGASTTKESIINAYNSSEIIQKKYNKEKVRQSEARNKDNKPEKVLITPEEIESIVMRAKKSGQDR